MADAVYGGLVVLVEEEEVEVVEVMFAGIEEYVEEGVISVVSVRVE